MQTRKIKVQAQHTPGTLYPPRTAATTPKLTLTGQWLQAAGFEPGTETEIDVNDGVLVIRAVKAPTARPASTGATWSEAEVRERVTFYNH